MAIFTPTITPGATTGPITGPITAPINPNLGNLLVDNFQISSYQNKYLDATGVQRLWKRTLEEIHASINNASAKIIPLDFSDGAITITQSDSMTDEDKAILSILMGLGTQDIMTWENNKTYYYSKSVNNTAYWYSSNSSQVDIITCDIVYSSDNKSITQATFRKIIDQYSAVSLVASDGSGALTYGNLAPFKTKGVTVTNESTTLGQDYIIIGDNNRTVKASGYKVLTGNITAGDSINLPTAGSVANYVTSAIEDAIEDATDDLVAIAEGKTKAYVIYAGENNSEFTKLTASIKISNDVNLVLANSNGTKTVSAGSLKVGEIIYLVDSNYPDRWVGQTSSSGPTLYAIDAKTDFSGYQKESDELTAISNITSGGGLLQRDPTGTWELTDQYRRPIYVNNTQVESLNSSTSNALNLVAGDNIQITAGSYAGGGVPVTITATDTKYNEATSTVLGLVKIGYSTDATNKKYAVALDNGKMYVNVPWTDTTYTAGTGLTLSNKQFSIKTLTTTEIDTILANTTID